MAYEGISHLQNKSSNTPKAHESILLRVLDFLRVLEESNSNAEYEIFTEMKLDQISNLVQFSSCSRQWSTLWSTRIDLRGGEASKYTLQSNFEA